MKFICYPKCSTCRKAQKYLDHKKIDYDLIDIKLERPTKEELKHYQKLSALSIDRFFNTSGLKYRELHLKEKLKTMSDEEKLDLLASDGMLVKRPLLVGEDFCLVGFRQDDYDKQFA